MPRHAFSLSRCLLASALCFSLAPLHAESQFAAPAEGARGALDFRIVIPPVIRLLENSYPEQLQPDAGGRLVGTQTLVVLSNMKHGFCVTLRRHRAAGDAATDWTLQAAQADGMTVEPAGDTWRLCAARPGRYALRLQHAFVPVAGEAGLAGAAAMAWPISADLAAI